MPRPTTTLNPSCARRAHALVHVRTAWTQSSLRRLRKVVCAARHCAPYSTATRRRACPRRGRPPTFREGADAVPWASPERAALRVAARPRRALLFVARLPERGVSASVPAAGAARYGLPAQGDPDACRAARAGAVLRRSTFSRTAAIAARLSRSDSGELRRGCAGRAAARRLA